MATFTSPSDPAIAGYSVLAPYYDGFTASYDYEAWIGSLETLALEHGLHGRALLDVACGTGKSFELLLRRGYRVTACDISPEMVARAADKFGASVDLFVSDMRALPDLGRFDLITCLDDSVNYLLGDGDLEAAFGGVGRSLEPGGLLVFDCNSAATYRSAFAMQFVREADDTLFVWRGEGTQTDGTERASIDVFSPDGEMWRRVVSHHVQRHYSRADVERALEAAGLVAVAVRGQLPGGKLELDSDEERHTKIVYLARRREGCS